jgi:hypothetical protein
LASWPDASDTPTTPRACHCRLILPRLAEIGYPIVIDTTSGTLSYDNYGGSWGEQQKLDQFVQAYAVAKARQDAHRRGYSIAETLLDDGSVRLLIREGW